MCVICLQTYITDEKALLISGSIDREVRLYNLKVYRETLYCPVLPSIANTVFADERGCGHVQIGSACPLPPSTLLHAAGGADLRLSGGY